MFWLHRFLLRFKVYQSFIYRTKRISLPGFNQLPLFDVTSFFLKEIGKEGLNTKATSLAFSFMLAIFPAIIFLFTLIPYIPIDNFQNQLLLVLSQLLPETAQKALQSTILDIVQQQNGGLLSLGFITALFFSTNGVVALMNAFNKSSLVLENRGFIRQRLVAIVLTLMLSLLVFTGIVVIAAGEFAIDFLHDEKIIKGPLSYYSLLFTRWIAIVAIFFFATSILYYFGPATQKRFRFISAGATLATILAILTSIGFAYYINHFGTYNKVYGSIGTLIVIMLWLYINSLILLIGFELNASIDITKRNLPPDPKPRLFNQLKELIKGQQ